jgi:1-acyl-sn-glycerol-3-phosphate acyltransferase
LTEKILKADRTLAKSTLSQNQGHSVINFPTTHVLPTTIAFNYGSFAMATKIKAAVIHRN